jgi:hypothetical protein
LKLLAAMLAAGAALTCSASAAEPAVPSFDRIVVVFFENKERTQVLGKAPTFTRYAAEYANLTRYSGVTHPSLPNYIAFVSGSLQGIRTNCTTCRVSARSLADTIESSGRSWKTYAEGLPRPGYLGAVSGRYAKKHNPFVYFRSVALSPARRARVVPFTHFWRDLRAGALPNFSLIVPDMCNSMHDCPVRVGDAWLRRLLPGLIELPNTVVFVLFDEGTSAVRGGGHIAALALGSAVRPRSRFTAVTDHYGALRTIEEAWGLPLLGRSARMPPITGIWRESAG